MARPRGFAPWNPAEESLALIDQVKMVLREYREHLPLTARQIFYRLVGAYGYEKTERAYSNLCEKLVRARRAQMIPFAAIRDDGTIQHPGAWGYDDPAQFWETLKDAGRGYKRDPREGQGYRVELWCEAAGMAPQLTRVAEPLGVPVYSTGGFSSVTVTHEIAQRASRSELPTIFLHIGDYDPSGESIFDAMSSDALNFYAGLNGGGYLSEHEDRFHAVRVALTAEQVEEYELPTAPPKSTDSRSRNWYDETCQAEAMPPDLLAQITETAILDWTDSELMERVEEEGDEERAKIVERLEEVEW